MRTDQIMERFKKSLAAIMMTAMLILLGAQTAFASTSYIKNISVRINVTPEAGESLPDLEAGENVTVSSTTRYDIDDVSWTKSTKDVELGDTYNLKITLGINDSDYQFKSSYSSSSITVKGGTFVSAKRNSTDELVITVKSKPAKGTLEEPDDLEWISDEYKNSKFGCAKWDSVEYAKYDVYLYRNDKVIHKVTNLTATSYNFYPYMTKEGDYTFRVRAVPKSKDVDEYADKSGWAHSGELTIDEDEVSDGTGQEKSDGTGQGKTDGTVSTDQVGWIQSNDKWYFRYPDGTYLKGSWGKINDVWYLFGSTGEMLTGWQKVGDLWYYMRSDGAMKTGWLCLNDVWYYLNSSGAMVTGWVTDNDRTYYMTSDGTMATGWKEADGEFYYFYPDGHKAINEVINGFYVDHNGIWHRP